MRHVGVVLAELRLTDRQRALVVRLRLRVPALRPVHDGQALRAMA